MTHPCAIAPVEHHVDRIITQHGGAAIDHMLGLIRNAVQAGDDAAVHHLDRIMRMIEQRWEKFGGAREK